MVEFIIKEDFMLDLKLSCLQSLYDKSLTF